MEEKDIIGKTFGYLTVLNLSKIKKIVVKRKNKDNTERSYISKRYIYKCRCHCGIETSTSRGNLLCGHTLSCGCLKRKSYNENKCWKGYGDISGRWWGQIKNHAKNRGMKVEITIKDAWNQYIKQDRKCALTGLPLTLKSSKKDYTTKTGSLDRIDNTKGYSKDNIQWVHKDVNWMKGKFEQKRFLELCKLITEHVNHVGLNRNR